MIESSHHSHDAALAAVPPTPSSAVAAVIVETHLLFIPDVQRPHWLLWGQDAVHSSLASLGELTSQVIPDQTLKLRRVRGYRLPLLEGVAQLVALKQNELTTLPASIAVWSVASKFALELVAREQFVPRVLKQSGVQVARWSVVLNQAHDLQRFEQLVSTFPVAAHAFPYQTEAHDVSAHRPSQVWSAAGLLLQCLDAVADQLVRASQTIQVQQKTKRPSRVAAVDSTESWPKRWQHALAGHDPEFVPGGVTERRVLAGLRDWVQPVLMPVRSLSLYLELSMPGAPDSNEFILAFGLQSKQQPEVQVTALTLFNQSEVAAQLINGEVQVAQEQLLQMLAVASRSFIPLELELRKSKPESMSLKPRMVYDFLLQVYTLEQLGVIVRLPEELQPEQRQRLHLCMRIGEGSHGANRQSHLRYRWQAVLAGESLSVADIDELLELRTPLARFNDQWVVLNQRELLHAAKLLAQNEKPETCTISFSLALSLALTEVITQPDSGLRIQVIAEGELSELVAQMRSRDILSQLPSPPELRAELRPYQLRGMSWLVQLTQFGLGACLADDMGLGKTVQWLAYLLHRRALHPHDSRPVLLVCPTSVIGNWEREAARFAPTLPLVRHYGADRHQNAEDFLTQVTGKLVVTSYGLLRRDLSWLKDIKFAVVALDEAQFIKNSASATARAARSLQASERIALTGTPVENHLAELWSIMEFLNPGLLGKREAFRREFAIPIERYGREDVALRLRRMVAPFVLRRVKTDPNVISDLPDKQESKVFCSLTREQASLYQSVVNQSLLDIEDSEGFARRGRVLALLTALKQICNHPAQYLKEEGPLAGRSGKLDRLLEMLEQVIAVGDRALIFTQYREMGERLVRVLSRLQGTTVPFLHGGTSRAVREEMVRRFQEDPRAPKLLVISLKAGGTGLNLTAATAVFHFDRWWNPAVEDQATDRAYRIGQQRNVQVYKMMCAGTIEEKIDAMLETKRDLAARIVSQGEAWITELDNQQLRELFALAPNAVVGDSSDVDELAELNDQSSVRARQTKA